MDNAHALRDRITDQIPTDAVTIDSDGETTEITLLYHDPHPKPKTDITPVGLLVALSKPNPEQLVAELLDRIYGVTSPDTTEVTNENGYFVITLTYQPGNSW